MNPNPQSEAKNQTNQPLDIVLLEESPDEFRLIETELERGGITHSTHWAKDEDAFDRLLHCNEPGIILTDTTFPDRTRDRVFEIAHETQPDVPLILLTDPDREALAIEALCHGATDYVVKTRLERLGPVVKRAASEFHARHAHREALRKLSEQESFYHSLVENLPLNIFRKDRLGRFTFVNQRFADLLGLKVEEILGRSDYDFYAEELAFKYRADDQRILSSGEVFETVEENRTDENDTRFVHVVKVPLLEQGNRRIGLQGVFWDITKAKQDEEAVYQQANLLNLVHDAIIVSDFNGQITFWNQGAEKLYHWPAEQALGRDVVELLSQDQAKFQKACEHLRRKDEWTGELRQRTGNGREIVVDSRWTLVRDRHNQPESIIVISSDISEKKRLEDQFLRAQRLEGVGALASGVAHDLNNILAPILMSAQLLRNGVNEEELDEVLNTIESCSERGANILRQLLTFGRGVEGERVVVKPGELLHEMVKIMRETFPKHVTVKETIADDLWTVIGDATQIHQVLLNLAVNARDAMPDGGIIRINAENTVIEEVDEPGFPAAPSGPYVRLSVTDNGSGIPDKVREKIFDPFFTTKPKDKGTGLGLSTTMGIVKSHRGFLRVQSRPGLGSTFEVCIPAGDADGTQMLFRNDVDEPKSKPTGTLLLVDDEPNVLTMLGRVLRHEGFDVCVARHGEEALRILEETESIDLVVTDIDMPNMTGTTLIETIRRRQLDLPIIVSTGLHTDDKISHLRDELGIRHFLAKPFPVKSLLKAISELLPS